MALWSRYESATRTQTGLASWDRHSHVSTRVRVLNSISRCGTWTVHCHLAEIRQRRRTPTSQHWPRPACRAVLPRTWLRRISLRFWRSAAFRIWRPSSVSYGITWAPRLLSSTSYVPGTLQATTFHQIARLADSVLAAAAATLEQLVQGLTVVAVLPPSADHPYEELTVVDTLIPESVPWRSDLQPYHMGYEVRPPLRVLFPLTPSFSSPPTPLPRHTSP